MSDEGVSYDVVGNYILHGLDEVPGRASAAATSLDHLGASMLRTEGLFRRMERYAIGYMGFEVVRHSVEGLIHTFVGLNSEMESLQIQLAGTFQAAGAPGLTGAENFQKAMGASAELIRKMRIDAAALPGTFNDLMQIFQPMIATGLQTGRSINQIEAFSARMMAFSQSMNVPSATAGHELEGLLLGNARSIMPLWRALKPIIVAHAQEFTFLNKQQRDSLGNLEKIQKAWGTLNVDQRIKLLQKATDSFAPAIDRVGSAWVSVSSTFEMYEENVRRAAGKPVFEEMTKIVSELNGYYEKNKQTIERTATAVGTKLAGGLRSAYHWAKDLFGLIDGHKDLLLNLGEGAAAYLVYRKGSQLLEHLGGNHRGGWGEGGLGSTWAARMLGNEGPPASTAFGSFAANRRMLEAAKQEELHARWFYMGHHHRYWRGLKAGAGQLWHSELMTMSAVGAPSVSQMLGAGAMSIALGRMTNDVSATHPVLQDFKDGFAGVTGALGQLPGPIGLVADGLKAVYQAANIFAKWVLDNQKDDNRRTVESGTVLGMLGKAEREHWLVQRARRGMTPLAAQLAGVDRYTLTKEHMDAVSRQAVLDEVKRWGLDTSSLYQGTMFGPGLKSDWMKQVASAGRAYGEKNYSDTAQTKLNEIIALAQKAISETDPLKLMGGPSALDNQGKSAGTKKAPVVNITIRQEINEAEDYDRVRVDTLRAIDKAFHHPTVASLNLGVAVKGP